MQDFVFKVFQQNNYIDLGMFQFGYERCKPAHSFGPAARNHYLFHYVISGTGTLYADNALGNTITYKVSSNEGFLLFPDQIATYIADNEQPWEYIWIEFYGLLVKEAVEISGLSQDNPIYRFPALEMRKKVLSEMQYIVQNKDSSPLNLIGHLYLFLDSLTHPIRETEPLQNSRKKNKTSQFYIDEAMKYVEINYQKGITVEEIAAHCGLNRSYFGKIFKEKYGKSPQEFLLQFRMNKACELLSRTKLSIGEVSNAVGYTNQLHFSRAFKSTYGLSPRQWRDKDKS